MPASGARLSLVLVLALAASACGSSLHARRGDEHVADGDPWAAVGEYNAALAREKLPPAEREAIRRRLEEAAALDALDKLTFVEDQIARNFEDAYARAWQIYARQGLLRTDRGRRAAEQMLTRMVAKRWPEVEALAGEDQWLRAYERARALTAPFADEHPLGQKRIAVRERGRLFHQRLADALSDKASHAAFLHRRVAAQLTGRPFSGEPLTPAEVPWVITEFRAPRGSGCDWLVESFPSARRPGADLASVVVDLRACQAEEKVWVSEEACTYPDFRVREETREEPYFVWESSCPEPTCLRRDRLGICREQSAADKTCAADTRVRRTRRRKVMRQEPYTNQSTCSRFHVQLTARVDGRIAVGYLQQQDTTPWAVEHVFEDQAIWTPTGHQHFRVKGAGSAQGLLRAKAEVVTHLRESIAGILRGQRHQYFTRQAAAAVRARDLGHEVEAEDTLVLAIASTGSEKLPGAEWLAARYGITPGRLYPLIAGQVGILNPPRPRARETFPPYDTSLSESRRQLQPVVNTSEREGIDLLASDLTIDLGVTLQHSPLASADLVPGIETTIRTSVVQLTAAGQQIQVGEQAEGFTLNLRVPIQFVEGVTLLTGLAYTFQASAEREHLHLLAPALTVQVPVFEPWVAAELGLQLNLLKLIDWAEPGGVHPRFYTPVSFGLVGFLGQRFYLRVRARHWIGAPNTYPVHLDGALGVRL